jgi:hypothetical protein
MQDDDQETLNVLYGKLEAAGHIAVVGATCPRCHNNGDSSLVQTDKHGQMCLDCLFEHADYTNVMGWCRDCYYQFAAAFGWQM